MSKTRKFAAATAAVGLLGGTAQSSATGVSNPNNPQESLTFNIMARPSPGLIVARQSGTKTSIQVTASLHRLKANRRYRVTASAKPCSQPLTGTDQGTWSLVTVPNTDFHWFRTKTVQRHGQLKDVKSVRLYDLGNAGGPKQVSCSKSKFATVTEE